MIKLRFDVVREIVLLCLPLLSLAKTAAGRFLTVPLNVSSEPDHRRQSELLSALVIILLVSTTVGYVLPLMMIPDYSHSTTPEAVCILACMAFWVIAYGLSRFSPNCCNAASSYHGRPLA